MTDRIDENPQPDDEPKPGARRPWHPPQFILTDIAATVWAPTYKRATLMQAPLALLSFVAGTTSWLLGSGLMWLVGALIIFAVVPFTLLVIKPTNNRLLTPGRDLASPETRALLAQWGRMHSLRSALSLIASAIFLWLLVRA